MESYRSETNVDVIVREAYAHLLKKYILHYGGKQPRFVMLGFDDVLEELSLELEQTLDHVVRPETSGKLREASQLRGNSEESCAILISKKNLGKFATLTTAFKILEEVIHVSTATHESRKDIHNLVDVSKFLLIKIDELSNFVQERIKAPPINYLGLKIVLKEIHKLADGKSSYFLWLHPRSVLRALVVSINENAKGAPISVAFFLRNLGIESTAVLERILLFKDINLVSENTEKLKDTLLSFAKVSRYFLSTNVSSQRKNLSNLCFNHLRIMLCELAESELSLGKNGKQVENFLDFENAFRENKKTVKKYQPEAHGVQILQRSNASGFPSQISLPVNITLDHEDSRNLLKEFIDGELAAIIEEYAKIKTTTLSIEPIKLSNNQKKLIIRFCFFQNNGNIKLDTYLDGLKSPTPKINKLLAQIKRKG